MDYNLKTNIVCYAGGTCGDLLCALIDPNNAVVDRNRVVLTDERSQLKKPHLFDNDHDKDLYLVNMAQKYQSIPSHDFLYHKNRQHSIIGITIDKLDTAKKASMRFKNLHRPEVWVEMQQFCGAQTIDDYAQILMDFSISIALYATVVVKLENIINGSVLSDLDNQGILVIDNGKEIYRRWLTSTMFS